MSIELSAAEVSRIKAHVVRLEAENAALRKGRGRIVVCSRCGTIAPATTVWRKFCSRACQKAAYNSLRRALYAQARDNGVSGRQAAATRRSQATAT